MMEHPTPLFAALQQRTDDLAVALARVGCDLHLAQLVWRVHHQGRGGRLEKTLEQLASRPHGLCCSESTAGRVVSEARAKKLLLVTTVRYQTGGVRCLGLEVDWEGIADVLRPGSAGRQVDTPSRQVDAPSRRVDVLYKEYSLFASFSKDSGPVPEAGTGPQRVRRRPARSWDELEEFLGLPAVVAPLDPQATRFGVFHVAGKAMLEDPLKMVEWFRRQLGAPHPATGPTGRELLLVLAAAWQAVHLPQDQVRKNRVALWIAYVSRQRWQAVLPGLPWAREKFDRMCSYFGPALIAGDVWPPQRKEPTKP